MLQLQKCDVRNKSVCIRLASQCVVVVVVGVGFFVCFAFLAIPRKDILKRFRSLSTETKPLEQQCARESALVLHIVNGVTHHSTAFTIFSSTFSVAAPQTSLLFDGTDKRQICFLTN